jgi:LmbE family N-acetylglucosaminyl deacetylase
MELKTTTAMIIMAHPDDSFIFAHNIRKALPMFQWLDVCVTYESCEERGREFKSAAKAMKSTPLLLGFDDDMYTPLDHNKLVRTITDSILKFKPAIIVTHNAKGEYGHGHHIGVYRAVIDAVNSLKATFNDLTIPLIVPSLNAGIADFITVGTDKSQSPCLDYYAREMYMIANFDLYSEGYCFANIMDDHAMRHKQLVDYISPQSIIYNPQQVINVDDTHA